MNKIVENFILKNLKLREIHMEPDYVKLENEEELLLEETHISVFQQDCLCTLCIKKYVSIQ